MHKKENSSIIIISHQEKILNIADEVILLVEGRIADSGEKDKILPELLALNSCGVAEKRC